MNLFLYIQPNETNTGNLVFLLQNILVANLISLVCITIIIFVHWKKGPQWYLPYSYYVFRLLLFTNYVFVPIIDITMISCVFFLPQFELKRDIISSWIVFYFFICCHRLIEYWITIRRSLVLDAQIYRERMRSTKNLRLEDL